MIWQGETETKIQFNSFQSCWGGFKIQSENLPEDEFSIFEPTFVIIRDEFITKVYRSQSQSNL